MYHRIRVFLAVLTAAALLLTSLFLSAINAQTPARYFAETGHIVQGAFLDYWTQNGALAQQGYPLTEEFQEMSTLDGKPYTVQYFERAVFEYHPENAAGHFDVLLAQLGAYELHARYPNGAPPGTQNAETPRVFTETGHLLGGAFRSYWETNGGLAQFGYPLTDEFQEVSRLDNKPYTVQYFERAVFERHPENPPGHFDVLLTQLGKYQLDNRYPNNSNPAAAPVLTPTSSPPATLTPSSDATKTPVPGQTPTVQSSPTPAPLPAALQQVAFGLDFDSNNCGELIGPLPTPVQYPADTTQIAFVILFDPLNGGLGSARVEGDSFPSNQYNSFHTCTRYAIINGQPIMSGLGVGGGRADGAPLTPGKNKLIIMFSGHQLEFPFEVLK